jgi:hypothetical protein
VLLHAAVGLDTAKRDQLATYLLEGLSDPRRSSQHTDYALLLTSLGGMNSSTAGTVADQLLQSLLDFKDPSDEFGTVYKLAKALHVAVSRMDLAEADYFAGQLSESVVSERLSGKLDHLSGVLIDVAAKLEPATCSRITDRLSAALAVEADSDRLARLSRTAMEVAKRLGPSALSHVGGKCAERLVAAIKTEQDTDKSIALFGALSMAVANLDQVAANRISNEATPRLVQLLVATAGDPKRFGRVDYLGSLLPHLSRQMVAPIADALIDGMVKESAVYRDAWVDVVDEVAPHLGPQEASRVVDRLLVTLAAEKSTAQA